MPQTGITLPIGHGLQALQAFQKLLTMPFDDALLAFAIGKAAAKLQLNPDLIAAEATRAGIAKKYAGGAATVPVEQFPAFALELKPIFEEEEEFELSPLPVTVTELCKVATKGGAKMTPAELMLLEAFCKKEE